MVNWSLINTVKGGQRSSKIKYTESLVNAHAWLAVGKILYCLVNLPALEDVIDVCISLGQEHRNAHKTISLFWSNGVKGWSSQVRPWLQDVCSCHIMKWTYIYSIAYVYVHKKLSTCYYEMHMYIMYVYIICSYVQWARMLVKLSMSLMPL